MKRSNLQEKPNNPLKTTAELLIVIILAIMVASIINGAFFDTTRVSGSSMNDTLYGGKSTNGDTVYDSTHYDVIPQDTIFDRVFFGASDIYGDKVLMIKTQNVDRGDIIVFLQKSGNVEQQWIKRVIGVAGDTITIADGKVYLNGELLVEDYVVGETMCYSSRVERTVEVGEGEIFVMGDNREQSKDSRYIGCIPVENIVGRVVFVVKKDTKKIVSVKNL